MRLLQLGSKNRFSVESYATLPAGINISYAWVPAGTTGTPVYDNTHFSFSPNGSLAPGSSLTISFQSQNNSACNAMSITSITVSP